MKRLQLIKAASDFAFNSLDAVDKVAAAEGSLAAFKAGGFNSEDLDVWTQAVENSRRTWSTIKLQKLPSEQSAQAANAHQPTAAAPEAPAA